MSPALRASAALIFVSSVAALFATQLSCSSSQKTPASGGAHYELQSFAGADPTLRCDDIGFQQDVATADKKLIVDGADGAVVSCSFDDTHFEIQLVTQTSGSVSASGTISGGKSTDATVSINVLGATYQNPTATKCTVTFVCPQGQTCDATTKLPSGSSIEGHFICPEVDNNRTAKECAIVGANPAGLSNSYFKFNDCN